MLHRPLSQGEFPDFSYSEQRFLRKSQHTGKHSTAEIIDISKQENEGTYLRMWKQYVRFCFLSKCTQSLLLITLQYCWQ